MLQFIARALIIGTIMAGLVLALMSARVVFE